MNAFIIMILGDLLVALGQLTSGVLRMDGDTLRIAQTASAGPAVAVILLFLAGLSDTIGQCVVLFVNRVDARRFALSVLSAAAFLVLGVFVWAFSIWAIAWGVFDARRPYTDVLTLVAVSHAPLLFGFFIVIPYLGNIIYYLLRMWMLLILLAGVGLTYSFGFWPALLCCALGWLLQQWITHSDLLRFARLRTWLWRVSTGRDRAAEAQSLADQWAEDQHLSLLRGKKDADAGGTAASTGKTNDGGAQ